MRRAVALPFNGYEWTVGGREDIPPVSASNAQRLTAAGTATNVIFPGKYELWNRKDVPAEKARGPLLLLPQQLVNLYRPLFLSIS